MDIEILNNFVEIIESGSITAASKKLYITQATLSMQLKNLEKELGTILLIRSAHILELTEAGKTLYRRAKSICTAASAMKSEISAIENGNTGKIRLGILSREGISSLDGILSAFSEKHREISYEFYEGNERELIELIGTGAVGAAVLRTPCTLSSDLNITVLSDEKAVAVYTGGIFPEDGDILSLSGKRIAVMRKYLPPLKKLFAEKARKNKQFVFPDISVIADSAAAVIGSADFAAELGVVPLSAARGSGRKIMILKENELVTERLFISARPTRLSGAERIFVDYVSSLSKQNL